MVEPLHEFRKHHFIQIYTKLSPIFFVSFITKTFEPSLATQLTQTEATGMLGRFKGLKVEKKKILKSGFVITLTLRRNYCKRQNYAQ